MPDSVSSGTSMTTTLSVSAWANTRLASSVRTAGCTMAFSSASAASSPNTCWATAARSSVPSSLRMASPKRSTIASSTG